MSEVRPYTIQHIQLEDFTGDFSPFGIRNIYFVFWWRQIPLGHLFFESNEQFTNSGLISKIIDVISPVIDSHISNKKEKPIYKQAFIDGDYPLFSKIMDNLFSDHLRGELPANVDISVVICTRNRSKELQTCIESLLDQVSMPQEIIIIDNAPDDDSTQKVAEQYDLVTYYREMRAGLDIARNTGARKAGFPVIAYVDDDVKVHPEWSYRIWETFEEKNIGAMTGLVIASGLDTESQQIFERHWEFNKGYQDKVFDCNFIQQKKAPRVWEIGAGANMAFRKAVLHEVNYFDERLDVGAAGCSGDSEIWYRILLAGYTIKYNPRAVSYHAHRQELGALHKQLFNYMRGHAAAALIQHSYNKDAGYKSYLYYYLPKYYLFLIRAGFPSYSFRYRTLWSEIKGLISGIRFFQRNKNIPPITRY